MKAISVFSGGLDSILAVEAIRAQGIDVLALFFETPFFGPEKARKSARAMDLALKVVNITRRHLEVVRHPKSGYGSAMNPCVDCHALMFRIAGEMLESEGAAFVFTGEVLGQRPMSQNRGSLNRVATQSGVHGLLVRPLSAKHLPPTIPEESGWIQRDQLFDFQGRSRKPQMEMAQRLSITDYPSPGGGCLLTEKGFSRRLKDLLAAKADVETRELELLKSGRHFRIGPHTKIVVGRNRKENETIQSLAGEQDIILKSVSVPGPTALLSGDLPGDILDMAAAITAAYSDTAGHDVSDVSIEQGTRKIRVLSTPVRDKGEFKGLMI
jgi:tRNA-uridine 2-sulfurtransferase